MEPENPSDGDLRVTNAYPVIRPGGRETGLRTHMGRRVQKVVGEYEDVALHFVALNLSCRF